MLVKGRKKGEKAFLGRKETDIYVAIYGQLTGLSVHLVKVALAPSMHGSSVKGSDLFSQRPLQQQRQRQHLGRKYIYLNQT